MSERRRFLTLVTGACGAAWACSSGTGDSPVAGPAGADVLEQAFRELNAAAGIGIAEDDFELSWDYAAGAYRAAASKLRPIVLDSDLELPVAFAAKRDGR